MTRAGKRLERRKPIGVSKAAAAGARAAAFLALFAIVGFALAYTWLTFASRAGGHHGWEIAAPVVILAAIYAGYAFAADQHRESDRKRREARRQRELLRRSERGGLYLPGPRDN